MESGLFPTDTELPSEQIPSYKTCTLSHIESRTLEATDSSASCCHRLKRLQTLRLSSDQDQGQVCDSCSPLCKNYFVSGPEVLLREAAKQGSPRRERVSGSKSGLMGLSSKIRSERSSAGNLYYFFKNLYSMCFFKFLNFFSA